MSRKMGKVFTITLFLAIIEHPIRPPRCYPSINHQTYSVIRATYPFFPEIYNQILMDAQEVEAKYVCIWQDDVAVEEDNLLQRMVKQINEPKTVCGLKTWAQETGYPQRLWMYNVEGLKPLIPFYPRFQDIDVCWQEQQKLVPKIIYINWSHWIPVTCNADIHSYILECWRKKHHWIDHNCTLNLTKKNYKLHPILKKHTEA